MAHCAANPVDWINDWVWTYDPRRKPATLPFDLFPRQEEFIGYLWEKEHAGRNGLAEKSRDVGFTWLCVAYFVHRWLFEPGFKGTFGSRKEMLVDKLGDPDSIFEKARFILRQLPAWMMPEGFSWKTHDNFCRLVNPANGATITGEAGDNMGRGGRSTLYVVDEAAFIERPQKVDAAVSQNSDCIIYVSTPNGTGNPFYQKRMSGAYDVFTFHWRDDPRKDEAWYQRQVDTLDPIIVAQEIDIDYSASIEGIIIARGLIEAAFDRELYGDQRGAITIGGDIAEFGSDACGAVVREGLNLHHLEEWRGHELTETTNRFIALGNTWEKKLQHGHKLYFFLDKIGVGAGVVSNLRAYVTKHGKPWVIVGVNAGETSPEEKCHRLKDGLWWRARAWFGEKQPAISQGVDRKLRDKLANELASPTYSITDGGLIAVESKKALKKRGVASPNLADALIHTFHWEAMKPEVDKRQGWQKEAAQAGAWGRL